MFQTCKKFLLSLAPLLVAVACLGGCEREERVLDVETPDGDVEVDRNIDTGEIEVDVDDQ